MPGPSSESAVPGNVSLMLPEIVNVVPAGGTIERSCVSASGAEVAWMPGVTNICAGPPSMVLDTVTLERLVFKAVLLLAVTASPTSAVLPLGNADIATAEPTSIQLAPLGTLAVE